VVDGKATARTGQPQREGKTGERPLERSDGSGCTDRVVPDGTQRTEL